MNSLDNKALEQKIYTLIGFCQKAGKMVSGDDGVMIAMSKGKVKLVIVPEDLSQNSLDKFQQKTRNQKMKNGQPAPVVTFGTKDSLGRAIGKSPRGLLGVVDPGFSEALNKYFTELNLRED